MDRGVGDLPSGDPPSKRNPFVKRMTALILTSVLVLAACGAGDAATAATVDGRNISVGDVNGLINVQEGTVSKADFAQFLGLMVEWTVVEKAAADEFDIIVSDEEITAEADRIFEEFSLEGQTREEFTTIRGVTEEFLRMVGHQEALYRRVHERFTDEGRGVPTEDEIEGRMESQRLALTEACVSHILLGELRGLEGDELESAQSDALAEAEEVLDLLDDGEDFAELARDRSTDTGSAALGGELECSSPVQWVQAFQDAVLEAPVGEVLDEPVLSEFGYHVILVRSRTVPTDDELVDAITSDSVSRSIDDWVAEQLGASEIAVVERFGSWDSTSLRVVAPQA